MPRKRDTKTPATKRATAVPRYENFRPRSASASRVGAGNRRQNTTPEILLRRALWAAGVRYRLHQAALPGRPDLVLVRHRVAVFCDGDFWHGRHWRTSKDRLAAGWNASYWVAKIDRNRRRDRQVTRRLRLLGWTVVRVWESDVRRDPVRAAVKILGMIEDRRDRSHP
jgi:DNA mismatch endonuclease, patch repair protein